MALPKGFLGKDVKIKIEDNATKQLQAFQRRQGVNSGNPGSIDYKAKAKIGLQLLNWTVNGSSKESVVPPIKFGILRGSGSVFVGSDFIGDTKGLIGEGTPNKDYTAPPDTITAGFNTSYATRVHETNWQPGPVSQQSGDVGNKFLQKHIMADGKSMTKLYAIFTKKENRA